MNRTMKTGVRYSLVVGGLYASLVCVNILYQTERSLHLLEKSERTDVLEEKVALARESKGEVDIGTKRLFIPLEFLFRSDQK